MHLDMKTSCPKCAAALAAEDEAYICSYECTYCPACASKMQNSCGHCGGELVRRPRRNSPESATSPESEQQLKTHPGVIWAISFGVWTFIAAAASATIYEMYRGMPGQMPFLRIAGLQFSSLLTYAPLTPFAFALATRYPVQRNNWGRRALLHLGMGLGFTLGHIVLRSATPYAFWDPASRNWSSVFWNSHLYHFSVVWPVVKRMFFLSVVDDITSAYIPIVVVAHAVSYYRRFRERELRATQLEGQLAKAHLQTLKSQLQPHFLFNTMHSISSLMLTDVGAADRMMTRLSDLLRLSLENNGTQMTSLIREIDFVNGYLEIERARFEDRMKVIFDIAPECLDAQVPHLLLQPLVENAVRHGISRMSSGGQIWISATHEGGSLEVRIRDNGPGMAAPGGSPKGGVGLSVTRERLATLYGRQQGCEIRNLSKGGVEVHLQMPFVCARKTA